MSLSTMIIVQKLFVQVLLNVVGTWLVNKARYLVTAGAIVFCCCNLVERPSYP